MAATVDPLGETHPASEEELKTGFRRAMRGVASTVHVITTCDLEGAWKGVTATAVTSVSMDPPSCLVCLNSEASVCAPLVEAGKFCINVLSEQQADIAGVFASSSARNQRFRSSNWETGAWGLPYATEAQAVIFCRLTTSLPYGSHRILVGEVGSVLVSSEPAPLVYCDGAYHVARHHGGIDADRGAPQVAASV